MKLPVFDQRVAWDRLSVEPPLKFPGAMLNVTNRCNLTCAHCFIYTDGNPNDPAHDIPDDELLAAVEQVRDRHGVVGMLWMGGERSTPNTYAGTALADLLPMRGSLSLPPLVVVVVSVARMGMHLCKNYVTRWAQLWVLPVRPLMPAGSPTNIR